MDSKMKTIKKNRRKRVTKKKKTRDGERTNNREKPKEKIKWHEVAMKIRKNVTTEGDEIRKIDNVIDRCREGKEVDRVGKENK